MIGEFLTPPFEIAHGAGKLGIAVERLGFSFYLCTSNLLWTSNSFFLFFFFFCNYASMYYRLVLLLLVAVVIDYHIFYNSRTGTRKSRRSLFGTYDR